MNLPLLPNRPPWTADIGLIPLSQDRLVNSMWGNMLIADDGQLYISAGNHETFGARTWLFRMNFETRKIEEVLDTGALRGARANTYAVGDSKIHTRLIQAGDGRLYFATMQGGIGHISKLPHYLHPSQYPGGRLLDFDPATGECRDWGVLVRGEGLQSAVIDHHRQVLYFVTWPKKLFVKFDLATKRVEVKGVLCWSPTSPEGEKQNFGRDIMMGENGCVYAIGNGGCLLRYNPRSDRIEETDIHARRSDSLRAHVVRRDGSIIFLTSKGHLFAFDPRSESVEELGPVTDQGGIYTPNLVLSPDETKLLYLAGSHGTYLGANLQLIEFNLKSRKRALRGILDPRFFLSYCYGAAADRSGNYYFALHGGEPADSYVAIFDSNRPDETPWLVRSGSDTGSQNGFFVGPGSEGHARGWIPTGYTVLGDRGKKAIPDGCSRISALVSGPDGCIYGATSAQTGGSSYLFRGDPGAESATVLARLSDSLWNAQQVKAPLVFGADGNLYGGSIDLIEDEWTEPSNNASYPPQVPQNYPGGHLFRYNLKDGSIGDLGIPMDGQGVYALCSDPSGKRIYALLFPSSALVCYDIETQQIQSLGRVYSPNTKALLPDEHGLAMGRLMDGGEFEARKRFLLEKRGLAIDTSDWPDDVLLRKCYLTRSIECDANGNIYGSHAEGFLFKFDCQTRKCEKLSARMPLVVGTEYGLIAEPSISALIRAPDGCLYGGTYQDGYLFRFDPETQRLANLGKPIGDNIIHDLAIWNGDLYGLVGEPIGKVHLFKYDLELGSIEDLGVLQGGGRTGFAVNAAESLCAGSDDRLYIGQSERISCLLHLDEIRYEPYQSP